MMTLRPDSSRFFRISSVSLLPNLCRHRNNFFLTLPWAWQRPLKRSNSMANRGYPLPVQVRSYRSSRRRSKAARDFRRVSMIVPQLSANDTFDLGDGLMRPDPYIMATGRVEIGRASCRERVCQYV